jgi:hypothetical protein
VVFACNYWFFDVNYIATIDGLYLAFHFKGTRCFGGRVWAAIGSGLWSVCCVFVGNRWCGLSTIYTGKWATLWNVKILMQKMKTVLFEILTYFIVSCRTMQQICVAI